MKWASQNAQKKLKNLNIKIECKIEFKKIEKLILRFDFECLFYSIVSLTSDQIRKLEFGIFYEQTAGLILLTKLSLNAYKLTMLISF